MFYFICGALAMFAFLAFAARLRTRQAGGANSRERVGETIVKKLNPGDRSNAD